MKRSILLLLLLSFAPTASAHPDFRFDGNWLPSSMLVWNLGIRFGVNLADGEPSIGVEASYVMHDAVAHGPVFGIDYWRGGTRWQLGYEVVTETTIGIEVGPTAHFVGRDNTFGWHLTAFGGAFIIPYYQWTRIDSVDFHELGSYLKVPVIAGYRDDDEW